MPYTVEDYKRDYVREHIHKLPLEDRLKGISPDDILKHISPSELIDALDKRLKNLSEQEKKLLLKKLLLP